MKYGKKSATNNNTPLNKFNSFNNKIGTITPSSDMALKSFRESMEEE